MIFKNYELEGSCLKEFNTEIRYLVATARADGKELISLNFPGLTDEREVKRVVHCAARLLGTMKREGSVQFFVQSLSNGSREAEFLKNKYSEFINQDGKFESIYVKL